MSQTFPPVRLAALDLDGTLLNHEGQVTPRTRAALQAASDRGVVIVPTTGRPLGNLPPVVAQLPGVTGISDFFLSSLCDTVHVI